MMARGMPGHRSTFSRTTLPGEGEQAPGSSPAPVLALVIAWSGYEPHRAGEIAFVIGSSVALGRGGDPTPEPRLRFHRQRPGALEPCPPLSSPGLSRRQLVLAATPGGVEVRRVGQCPLEVNGRTCEQAPIAPGDVLRMRRELVLLCVERPSSLLPTTLFPARASQPFGHPDPFGMVGESPRIWQLRENLAFAANTNTHVLLLGESGTGKELAARAVHALSPRPKGPFVSRNAATLPPGLVDAELFGNVRNYPNVGMPERRGLVGEADGGTLFLDEIGELPMELQAHLLRVLDSEGEYQRLGEALARRSSLRIVAATNRPIETLKQDFSARFPARVELPPLDARKEDIPLLASRLVLRAAERSPAVAARFVDARGPSPFARLSPTLVDHLLRRSYPRNARELEATLWEAMSGSIGDVIELPPHLAPSPPSTVAPRPPGSEPTAEDVQAALDRHGGNMAVAARSLGLSSRFVLYRRMKKLGMG